MGRSARAGEARLGDARHHDFGAVIERRIDARDVLEQRRERQRAKMPRNPRLRDGARARVGDGVHARLAQAHAFRLPRRARRVADLRGAAGIGDGGIRRAAGTNARSPPTLGTSTASAMSVASTGSRGSASSASAPLSASACAICSREKKGGSGTSTVPAICAARSTASQCGAVIGRERRRLGSRALQDLLRDARHARSRRSR